MSSRSITSVLAIFVLMIASATAFGSTPDSAWVHDSNGDSSYVELSAIGRAQLIVDTSNDIVAVDNFDKAVDNLKVLADAQKTVDSLTVVRDEAEAQTLRDTVESMVPAIKAMKLNVTNAINSVGGDFYKFAAVQLALGIPWNGININADPDDYSSILTTAYMIYHGTWQIGGGSERKVYAAIKSQGTSYDDTELRGAITDLTDGVAWNTNNILVNTRWNDNQDKAIQAIAAGQRAILSIMQTVKSKDSHKTRGDTVERLRQAYDEAGIDYPFPEDGN